MRPTRIILILASLILGALLIYNLSFVGKIFPNTFIAGADVGGMKPEQASSFLKESIKIPEKVKLVTSTESFDLNSKDMGLTYDFDKSAKRAYGLTRTGDLVQDFVSRINLLWTKKGIGLETNLNEESLNKIISVVAGQVSIDPVYPSAKFTNGKLVVSNGVPGTLLDQNLLRAQIGRSLSLANSTDIQIPTEEVDTRLSAKEIEDFTVRANKYLGRSIEAKFEFDSSKFNENQILSFLNFRGGFEEEEIKNSIFAIAKKINRDPQEPKFSFEGGKVNEFQPAKDGVRVDSEKLTNVLKEKIITLETSEEKIIIFEVPVSKTHPALTTDKVNSLGINTLIGRGTSRYKGSIPSRIHNVSVATAKINGILIKPGETLSFNEALGDVSKFTGYKEAYVIKDGKTVLGDGGGVCQVSTTLFRAALNAGLTISERRAHAYRVGYYEQDGSPGIDATVYAPSPDLKITNNTPAHILIQATADSKNQSLVFELYGTSDGRISEVSKPVITSVTPAGPDVYIDDPTLPTGTIKQTEHRANGAKVVFSYKVTRNGETLTNTKFTSSYRPWAAVYLKGTGPAN